EVKRFLQDMEFTSLLDRFIKPREHKKLEYKEIGLKDVLNKITKGDWAIEVEDGYIALSGLGESYIVNVCPDDMGEALKSIVKANANISGHNLKKIYKKYPSLTDSNIRFFMDIELGAYLITPEGVSYGLESIYFREFGERLDDYTGQPELFIEKESLIKNIVSRAGAIFRLIKPIKDKLDSAGLTGVLKDIEMPLTPVLARMENRGVLIDSGILADLSKSVQTKIEEMEERIYSEVGERFNIASPKQLSKILFDKLGLPTQRKTKTGYSTDSEVLETLSKMHPVPRMIIEHRTLSKMKSTYIDALPTYINKDTGRIHTTFLQTSTSTGRLSSRDPNLQNIPIRTEIGSQIRQAFIAPDDRLLLSADYSQIELRILAHMSGDENLIEAFKRNEDIHTRTAKEIFPGAEIDGELRRRAKAVNFGLIYGKTPHGLSQELGISHEEASEYIEKYFSRFPAVREFMDTLIKSAHEKGYAETMFGRRRYLPELKSENATIRSSAERAALNMPIQGTAADIMKMVMIEIEKTLSKTEYGFMILTIHDELLFEVMENKIEEVKDLVKDKMEGIIKLAMPVVVDIGWGKNWLEAH
ncbi:MAG: DNA polymerase I, partial [Candidatus Coatesbacteria bacterium]